MLQASTWNAFGFLLAGILFYPAAGQAAIQETSDPAGLWTAAIESPGGELLFGLEVARPAGEVGEWQAWLLNGRERIPVPTVQFSDGRLKLGIDHYDSNLELEVGNAANGTPAMHGIWTRRRGQDRWTRMNVSARKQDAPTGNIDEANRFAGRWSVQFSDSKDPAVGIFETNAAGGLEGTFLTTTGDYRFLAGSAEGSSMYLSCFDGAHAFLFKASLGDDGNLAGDFWSSDTWHETFSASRDDDAQLPDSFGQTMVNQQFRWQGLELPGLDGERIHPGGPDWAGSPRIIYFFGSWCPNCHDAAEVLAEFDREYGPRGLKILGIAFELTGEVERDAEQVQKYLDRHGCKYPVALGGGSDKEQASRTFPVVDRIRAWPTTIFIDRSDRVVAVHTGFSGPATGEEHEKLKQEFRRRIESMLKE